MRWMFALFLVIASALTSVCGAGFQVNTRTTYKQSVPAIAMDADSNFVVVWRSYRHDGDSGGIFGQRFDPNCSPVGAEFQINTTTSGDQTEPAIAMDRTGNFVVAWHGPGVSEEDVFARRFDTNAQPLSQEFRVNSFTDNRQRFPKAATSQTGAFVVVWESEKPDAEDYVWAAAGQLYNANGTAIGNEFQPSQIPDCRYPDVAMDAHGNFVVVWMHNTSKNAIMAKLYDADSTPKKDPFKVSSVGFGSISRPSVATDSSGNFVVTWDGHHQWASLDDIHARWWKFDGTAMGEQFLVNTTLGRAQQRPRIAMTSQGEFVIVWHSQSGVEDNGKDVFAQRYNASCTPVGYEAQLNRYTADDQKYAAVAIAPTAKFVAVWQSDGQDGSDYGIFATSSVRTCPADFSDDGFVNFLDYCVLAEEWRTSGDSLTADLIADNIIDPRDLAEFCRRWLTPCQNCGEPQ